MDISFQNREGIKGLKLLKKIDSKFSEFKYLVLFLKAYLKVRDLAEVYHGGCPSFVLCILVATFLKESY